MKSNICDTLFHVSFSFTVTEHDPGLPWIVTGVAQRTVKLEVDLILRLGARRSGRRTSSRSSSTRGTYSRGHGSRPRGA